MEILKQLRKNSIIVVIGLILVLLVINTIFTYRNKNIIVKNAIVIHESEAMQAQSNQLINELLHNFDLGLRAYGLTKNDALFSPARDAVKFLDNRFDYLKTGLQAQQYNTAPVEELRSEYKEYAEYVLHMKQLVDADSMDAFRKLFDEDRGLKVFMKWSEVGMKINDFETNLKNDANSQYETAVNNTLYLQILILLIGFPTLGYVVYKIRNDERGRHSLLAELEENNRKYIFNPGTSPELDDPKKVISNSIENLQRASAFIQSISKGQYSVEWQGLNKENIALNEDNLAGRLSDMRDQLQQMKYEEQRRLWTNEGLTKFSETVRNHQSNLVQLANEVIRFITKYLGAQQGGLFIVREEEARPYLDLAACYAYDRKKYIERRIEAGVGLIGQAYLEGQTTILTKLPQGYTYITSGMGETTPGCVLIVPMKYNNKTEAIVEIASLEKFQDYQIAFLEKAGEFVASALQSARTTEKMQELLTASQRQAEEMRATEEELRQNFEELQATQEAMTRKQQELDRIQEDAVERIKNLAKNTNNN